MLFFRRFIHDILPALLVGLAILIFSLFSFAKGAGAITQRETLAHANFTELFYTSSAFVNPKTQERKDTFADFAGVGILKTGERTMASDVFMVMPQYTYDDALPFFDERINSLQKGECLVSSNVMSLRHTKVGDQLTSNDPHMDPVTIKGELIPIQGFENEHFGVIVMGFDLDFLSFLASSKPRYVTFSRERVEDFGQVEVYGRVISKNELVHNASEESIPRMVWAALTPAIACLAVAGLTYRSDKRKKAALIARGAKRKDIYLYFLGNKALFYLVPSLAIGAIFLLLNLDYVFGALALFAIIGAASLIMTLAHATALQVRS